MSPTRDGRTPVIVKKRNTETESSSLLCWPRCHLPYSDSNASINSTRKIPANGRPVSEELRLKSGQVADHIKLIPQR